METTWPIGSPSRQASLPRTEAEGGPIFPRYTTCILIAALLLVALSCRADDSDVQNSMAAILAEEGLTGAVWALVDEADEVTLGAAGLQDNLNRAAFTTDHRIHVGSLTKTLLATGVLRLATEGKIELDAPATRYLPALSFDNPWQNDAVTVRHLLDHTSGLNDAHLWQMFSERANPDAPLIAAFPESSVQLRIRSRPGSRFSYSNMGYTLVGMIIESVVGGRYEFFLDEYLLVPLKMHDSTFSFTSQEGQGADPMLAWGHVDDGSRYAASPIFLRPAGQFTTTAADLARFAQFLLSDGAIDGEQFIDDELMRIRGRPVATEAADNGLQAGYALGLGRRDRHNVVGYCHGGNIVGFVAMLCIYPGEHKAFAYSVNTDHETADYGRIDRLLISALGVAAAVPPQSAVPVPDIESWHGQYILSPNRFQAFEYLDDVFGAVRISSAGDSLLMESLQAADRQLRPVGGRRYSANDRTTTSHVFMKGKDGEYLLGDGFRTYEKTSATYLLLHWISLTLGMAGLFWIFLAGAISLVRHRGQVLRRSETPAFVAIALLVVPLPFFFGQSFMALGDVTLASILLALVTLLLPAGMLLTLLQAWKLRSQSRANLLHGIAALCVLQWCAVLISAGMLPLRLWA